jgi:ribosomal protein S18 acetylase RimI-like enzyme
MALDVEDLDLLGAKMDISQAIVDDIPKLCGILALLFEQEAEFRPDPKLQAAGLRRIIESPETGRILVLRDGPEIIGMVNLLFTVSTALGGRVAILEDMVVISEFRERGAGSLLLSEAVAFAKSQGCLRITLLTDKDNESAQRFYKSHGFYESAMVPMRLLLTP